MRHRQSNSRAVRALSRKLAIGSGILGLGLVVFAAGCSSDTDESAKAKQQHAITVPTTAYEFEIVVPQGATRALLSASNRLTLNGQGTVGLAGTIANVAGFGTSGQLNIQASSNIYANVYSGASIQLNSQSVIHGNAQSAGQINVQQPIQILGTTTENTPPPSSTITWSVDWPDQAGAPIERNAAGGALPPPGDPGEELAPGNYGRFSVQARNRITLRSGTYFFTDFNLDADAEIRIDSSNGPVQIYTRNSARVVGLILPAQNSAGEPIVEAGRVLLGYRGQGQVELTGGFIGTVVAPNAEVRLNAPRNNGQHKGSFYGRDVTNDSNTNLPTIPLDIDLIDLLDDPTGGGGTGGSGNAGPCPDADQDEVCNVDDECTLDPEKSERGACDCHVADVDADNDQVPSCVDDDDTNPDIQVEGGCSDKPDGAFCRNTRCSSVEATCQGEICGAACPPDVPGNETCFSLDYAGKAGDSSYWFCPVNVDWATAQAACTAEEGRTLAVSNDALEHYWLRSVADFDAWTGLNRISGDWYAAYRDDLDAERIWVGDTSGYAYQGAFENWAEGHPATGARAFLSDAGEWISASSSTTRGFICEQGLQNPDSDGPPPPKDIPGGIAACVDSPFEDGEWPDGDVPDAERDAFRAAAEECAQCVEEPCDGSGPGHNLCEGVLSVPTGNDCTDNDPPERTLNCDFDPTWNPGPIENLTQCDPGENGTDNSACIGGDICGRLEYTPVAGEPPRNIFVCGPPGLYCAYTYDQVPEHDLCDETVICNPELETATVTYDDLLNGGGSNLTGAPVEPEDLFEPTEPFDETILVPGIKPPTCGTELDGDAPCALGTSHPWCDPNADPADENLLEPTSEDDPVNPLSDRQGETPRGQKVEFDFDPNMTLMYDVSPGLYGDAGVDIEASISLGASVRINDFMGYTSPTLDIIDAYAGGSVQRCSAGVDARLVLLGHDFLPDLLSDSQQSTLDSLGAVDFGEECTTLQENYLDTLGKAKKAYRDAQEIARQYRAAIDAGMEFPADFCAQLIQAKTPEGFEEINCATATPNQVVNAFIDYSEYVLLNELSALTPYLEADEPLLTDSFRFPSAGNKESQTIASVNFAIGPVPMNLSIDLFFEYGLGGSAGYNFDPNNAMQALKDTSRHTIAAAYADVGPYAEAGIDLFLGVGFSFGPLEAKLGISGEVSVGRVDVPGRARAYIAVQAVDDERELDGESAALVATGGDAGVIFPENGKSAFKFYSGFDLSVGVEVSNILRGELYAKLRIKFFFFSKSWKKQIVAFGGLPTARFELIPPIDRRGELGTVRMPFTFPRLARFPNPPPAPPVDDGMGGAPSEPEVFEFDMGRAETFFYKELCEDPVIQACPDIFAENGLLFPRMENTNVVAYGSTGMDLHDRVALHWGTGPASAAVKSGHAVLRNDVSLENLWGSDTHDVWHRVSYEGIFTNLIPVVNVPEIILQEPAYPPNYSQSGTVHVVSGETKQLAAGSRYDTLIVDNGGVLVLNGEALAADTPQQFFFNNLQVEPGGVVRINHAEGAVVVVIHNSFTWKGRLENGTGEPNAHVFGVFGSGVTYMQSIYGFKGTVVTPNGKLELNSRAYEGAYYGKFLEVHQDAVLSYDPCDI